VTVAIAIEKINEYFPLIAKINAVVSPLTHKHSLRFGVLPGVECVSITDFLQKSGRNGSAGKFHFTD
jgi:hypothetical protein